MTNPQPTPSGDLAANDDECCRCEPSDWAPPPGFPTDGSVAGLASLAGGAAVNDEATYVPDLIEAAHALVAALHATLNHFSIKRIGHSTLADSTVRGAAHAAAQAMQASLKAMQVVNTVAVAPSLALPQEPPPGLLMSMAVRYDHGLAVSGHYDQLTHVLHGGASHAQRLDSTLRTMRQLYEEVAGFGFYRPEHEATYAAAAKAGLAPATKGAGDAAG